MARSRCFQVRLGVGRLHSRSTGYEIKPSSCQDEARELSTSGQARRNTLESRDGISVELVSLTAGPSSSAATETIYLAPHKRTPIRAAPSPAHGDGHHALPLPSTSAAVPAAAPPSPPELRELASGESRNSWRNLSCLASRTAKASVYSTGPSAGGGDVNEIIDAVEIGSTVPGAPFLAKVVVVIGIATTITVILLFMKHPPSGPSLSLPQIVDAQSDAAAATIGYTFSVFGKKVIIPEYTPGWVYFLLLMAAGFGLVISEEALNVWVGISLGRTLCLDGTWQSLVNSFLANSSYIISTLLWVYWGVCISDMMPFYLGKLFRQSGVSGDISSKVGIGKEKVLGISRGVEKYGNLIGFVERFSIRVRNATAFRVGALGISADCYFVGVCCGCLITLPIQLAVGFALGERPVVALASVAAVVGVCTVFPYVAAACTALFIYLHQRKSSS